MTSGISPRDFVEAIVQKYTDPLKQIAVGLRKVEITVDGGHILMRGMKIPYAFRSLNIIVVVDDDDDDVIVTTDIEFTIGVSRRLAGYTSIKSTETGVLIDEFTLGGEPVSVETWKSIILRKL